MSTKRYYSVSKSTLSLWYDMCGINSKYLNTFFENNDSFNAGDLYELSPYCLLNNNCPWVLQKLPESSREIDEKMQLFIQNLCEMGMNDEFQNLYSQSYMSIIEVATNLNLVSPDRNFSYELHFLRLNHIILLVLKSLSALTELEVIELAKAIKNRNINKINEICSSKSINYLECIIFLGMCNDNEIDDSIIFEDNTNKINLERLLNLVLNKIPEINNNKQDIGELSPLIKMKLLSRRRFYRISYEESIKIDSESIS